MKKIGYACTSAEEQTLALQIDALRASGCVSIHEDQLSGIAANQSGLAAAIAACAAGDVLHVWKLDRLGHSMVELVRIVDDLRRRGVGLKVLTGEGATIDTTQPEANQILGVSAAFAEFKRELIRERTKAGMCAARRRGKHIGRPPVLSPELLDIARRMIAENKSKGTVARMIGVDRSTLWRALRQSGERDAESAP